MALGLLDSRQKFEIGSQDSAEEILSIANKRLSIERWAFVAVVAFVISFYSSIVNLFPALEVARPALATAAVAAFILLFASIVENRPFTLDGWGGFFLLGLAVWTWLSVIWSINPIVTSMDGMELLKLVAIYLTLVNLLNTPKRIAIASGAAVLGALVPAIGTIDQWWRGIDLMDGYRARWLGVYLDPNHLAMSLVAVVPMAVTLAMIAPWTWLKIVSAIAGILFIAAIVFSHSRGGALGLAAAMMLWAVLGKKRIRNLAIVGGILVGTVICSPKSFLDRTQSISSYEDDVSAHGRIWAWEATAAIIRDHPLTGVGAGAFRDAWPDYVKGYEARLARFVAHNIFLAELGELGILGFILLLGFVSHAIGGAAKAAADSQIGNIAQAVASGFGGYIICDMMSGYVLSAHFFFLAAIAAACGRCLIRSGAVHGKLAEL